MNANEELITRFYSAMQQRDAAGMGACYHPDVVFSDPVFPDLTGDRARAMWEMLCARGTDMQVEFSGVAADDATGRAHWEARYTFSTTGRKVHNIVDASFEFRDGLIVQHTDRFDFRRWCGQALGTPGRLLGGTPFMRKKVQAFGARSLGAYLREAP